MPQQAPAVVMESGGVLLLSSWDDTADISDLEIEERAIAALQVPAAVIRIGSAVTKAESHPGQMVETTPTALRIRINDAIKGRDFRVVKIGAILSKDIVKIVSELLEQNDMGLKSVLDLGCLYQPELDIPEPDLLIALQKHLLPQVTLIYATVPEAMQLLKGAGTPTNHPRGIPDVQVMAKTLAQTLGPQYVAIKREFVDEDDGAITLHYVLVGGSADTQPPILETFRFENPRQLIGASKCIPSLIAAYLSKGQGIREAVSAGFRCVEGILKDEDGSGDNCEIVTG